MASGVVRFPSINPISPLGLALISYFLFLACFFIPPSTYENIMGEQDFMFLNPGLYLFFSLCVMSFVAGDLILRGRKIKVVEIKRRERSLKTWQISLPLLVGICLNCISIAMFMRANSNFLVGWLEDAHAAKRDLDVSGGLTEALPLLYAFCCWGLWRLLEKEKILGQPDYFVRIIICIGVVTATFTAIAKVARYDLMPGVFGIFITYFIFKSKNNKSVFFKYLFTLFRFALIVVGIFVIFSWLRGGDEKSALLQDLFGYTGASYNRLAALLDGDIIFPYGGTGTYAFRFLSHIPFLQRWIDLSSFFGIPDSADVWASEFGAVHKSGLDGRYIWVSTFGYIYSDLSWFVFLYLFILGIVFKYSWLKILKGNVFGIIIYPWAAFSILFWFGSNYFVYSRLLTLLGGVIFLSIYEFVLKKKWSLRI